VYDPATVLPIGGGAQLAPPEAFNTHVSRVGADLFVVRGSGASEWTTALDPLTLQPRTGSPKSVPPVCTTRSVEPAGLYCTFDDGENGEVQLRKLTDYTTLLRTFQVPRPVSMEIADDHMLMLSNNQDVYILDSQLTQLGSPIPAVDPLARTLSVSMDRIAIAFYLSETESSVRLYSLTTHAQIGAEKIFAGHGDISGLVFTDDALVVTFKPGHVLAMAVDGTGAETVPLVTRGGDRLKLPTYDATRNRILGLDYSAGMPHLIVLDSDTLQHVPGSPATLPKPGAALLVF